MAASKQCNSRERERTNQRGNRPEGFDPSTAKGRQKDCDARWTKKSNEVHYDYKNHVKVDTKSKLVSAYATTPASVHDSQVLEELVDEDDEAVFADSTYQSESSEAFLLEKNCQNFILFKATRNHPLSDEENPTNKTHSRIRVRCEHLFGPMSQMAMDRLRTIGLARANQHNALSNLIYNMDRYAFLCR